MQARAAAVALLTALAATPALAAGDLATKVTKLPELRLGSPESDFSVSQTSYELETGKAYRLPITSNGAKEMAWMAPDFFRNVWVREVRVGELEIHTPVVGHVAFDGEGTIDLFFVPIRTGTYAWEVAGLAERGMRGTITVR